MKKLLAIVSSVFLAATAFAGEFPDITITDLKSAIATKKVTIVDVNGPESFQRGHIPGAVSFKSEAALASALPKDKNALVVAYCGGPGCNAYQAAAKVAKKLGYKNVKHLSSGISGWLQAGEATEKAN